MCRIDSGVSAMKNSESDYMRKLITAEEAAKIVQSGDTVFMGHFALLPDTFDEALAERTEELEEVKIEGICTMTIPRVIQADPEQNHFVMGDWHISASERSLYKRNLVSYIPMLYHRAPRMIRKYRYYDVVAIPATPIDERGYFNYGLCNSFLPAIIDKAKRIIIEVNPAIPKCFGGNQEAIHISRVDHVIEGTNKGLLQVESAEPSETNRKTAEYIMRELEDGCCIQLGIGGLPNVVGSMISQSDLKDLGIHSEMFVDSMVDMYHSGKITGARKNIDRYKIAYTFGMGSNKLYDFLRENPSCASYPVDYTNHPKIISLNDKVVAINNALHIDLFGQASSESVGSMQISGTGGQFDFIFGAFMSHGGKGIIGMDSTYKNKNGERESRIVPTLEAGTIVTVPRTVVQYVATEYGIVQLKSKSVRERAELLISIAHPDLREWLIKSAEELGIWRRCA